MFQTVSVELKRAYIYPSNTNNFHYGKTLKSEKCMIINLPPQIKFVCIGARRTVFNSTGDLQNTLVTIIETRKLIGKYLIL